MTKLSCKLLHAFRISLISLYLTLAHIFLYRIFANWHRFMSIFSIIERKYSYSGISSVLISDTWWRWVGRWISISSVWISFVAYSANNCKVKKSSPNLFIERLRTVLSISTFLENLGKSKFGKYWMWSS